VKSDHPSARLGETIENPATGERIRWRATRESSGGERLCFDYWAEPGRVKPAPDHRHPHQREHLTVASGVATVRLNGSKLRLSAGQSLLIEAGSAHSLWPASSGGPLHMVAELRPALDMEGFLGQLFAAATTNPLRLAFALRDHPDEIELTRVPVFIQRLALKLLAALAGHR
jgi:mannose-6-phosphate isomerase-like protein (cupin superfamily)